MADDSKNSIERLNNLKVDDLHTQLFRCCGNDEWCRKVANLFPVSSFKELRDGADDIWWSMSPEDWLVAFLAHPRIGDKKALAAKMASNAHSWEGDEQKLAVGENMTLLEQRNVEYEQIFGHIFLICATGKTAEDMLEAIERRMENDAALEVRVAAGEQAKITQLRLAKLLQSM